MLYLNMSNKENTNTMNTSYKISDTSNGMFLNVTLPEGNFNLSLQSFRGMNNRREFKVVGSYPKDKYSITYEGGHVSILEIGGEFTKGQKVTHKAFGKGRITQVSDSAISIEFNKIGQKTLAKSIAKNFLK